MVKATTSKTDPSLTFGISYGFLGGPLNSRELRRQMNAAGFTHTTLRDAEVIVAHSAGCWLIPEGCSPKIVIYVGLPLSQTRPFKAWLATNLTGYRRGQIATTLRTHMKSAYYGVAQPLRNLKIIRMAKTAKPTVFGHAHTVFIASHDDPWLRPKDAQAYAADKPWAFISFAGMHDNIWEQPDKYVEIIKHYARLLA